MTEQGLVQKRGCLWQVYTISTSVQQADDLFVLKYGYEAKEIIIVNGSLLLGPVEINEAREVRQ